MMLEDLVDDCVFLILNFLNLRELCVFRSVDRRSKTIVDVFLNCHLSQLRFHTAQSKKSFMLMKTVNVEVIQNLVSISSPHVTVVDLSHCWYPIDTALRCIVERFQMLKNVNLSYNQHVCDISVKLIAAGCQHLQILNLAECQKLTDAAIHCVAENLKMLRSLNLKRCYLLSDESIRHIAENCLQLRSIDLDYCKRIGDPSLDAMIANLLYINCVKADDCLISYGGRAKIDAHILKHNPTYVAPPNSMFTSR